MNKKVLITGGAGFIGSHTVEEFLANDYQVTVLDNLRTGDIENIRHVLPHITFVEGDILDAEILRKHIDGETRIVNLAALISVPESVDKPTLAHQINVSGAELVMSIAREKNAVCFVSASSAAVYGNNAEMPLTEESKTVPISPYGLHKYVNELYGRTYSNLYNFPSVFLRFFNVFGPRQKFQGGYASVIPAFINKILTNEPATIFGSGEIVRDYVYVKDIARAIRAAVEHAEEQGGRGNMEGVKSVIRASTENTVDGSTVGMDDCTAKDIENASGTQFGRKYFNVFNIATGASTTLDQLWNTMCKIKGLDMKPAYGPTRTGDVFACYATGEKARNVLNFETKTSLEEGLRELFDSIEPQR
jgi:nucleoside-diphosphate-sugar epimerase